MRFFLQSKQDPDITYEIVEVDMDREEVILQGPLAKIVVCWANDTFESFGYKLVKEDGSDAKLEELQAEL